MISAEYIKTFIPIQELDEIQPADSTQVADVKDDDLLLMSQIREYASRNSNAVAVSKKINYKNFSEKISDDFEIASIKLSIEQIYEPINDLSNDLYETSSFLSNQIICSSDVLSSYSEELCSLLSAAVKDQYISQYGTQTCSLIDKTDDSNNPAYFTTSVTLSDGYITNIQKSAISDLIVPQYWKLVCGAIASDICASQTSVLTSPQQTIQYEVLSDCYVNCMLSAKENDSSNPIEVWLSSNNGQTTASSLYCTLNNPGGFSGKYYFNNYNFQIPVKRLNGARIVVKYQDGSSFNSGSKAVFDCYSFYAVPSKDDLSGYVKKPYPSQTPLDAASVCRINVNNDGVITSIASVYYDVGTDAQLGLIKTNGSSSFPRYALSADNDKFGFVSIPAATSSECGLIKLNLSSDGSHLNGNDGAAWLSCGLERMNDDKGVTFIPAASDEKLGVVMLNTGTIISSSSGAQDSYVHPLSSLSSYIGIDENGKAYVTIPWADHNVPGVMCTGIPDTTPVRVVRSVYVDTDGFAKVNVVNTLGVGMFADDTGEAGYNMSVVVPLNSSTQAGNTVISSFDGSSSECSSYGDYLFSKSIITDDGWFTAQLVYEDIGHDYAGQNPCLQIICDKTAVTTIHPSQVQGSTGKKFTYSAYLGVFRGIDMTFGAVSDLSNFGNDAKLTFLIKTVSDN